MTNEELMKKLEWNDFSTYPNQGDDIYVRCFCDDGRCKLVLVKQFNAVTFKPERITNEKEKYKWTFQWAKALK